MEVRMNYSQYGSRQTHKIFDEFTSKHLVKYETKENYLRELNFLMDFLQKDALAVSEEDAVKYYGHLKLRMASNTITYETLARKMKQLSSMYLFFASSSESSVPDSFIDPFANIYIKDPEYTYTMNSVKTHQEINDFFDYVRSVTVQGYIMCQTLYFGLLKPAELLALKRSNMTLTEDSGYLIITSSNSRKQRTLKIPVELGLLIQSMISKHDNEFLFINKKSKPLSKRSFQMQLKKYSDAFITDDSEGYTPSSIYHAGIFHALQAGMSKEALVEQLAITDTKFLDRYNLAIAPSDSIVSSCDFIKIVVEKEI